MNPCHEPGRTRIRNKVHGLPSSRLYQAKLNISLLYLTVMAEMGRITHRATCITTYVLILSHKYYLSKANNILHIFVKSCVFLDICWKEKGSPFN